MSGKPADDALTRANAAAIAAIEARRRGAAGDEVEVGEDEADAIRLFLALSLQWRFHGFSGQRLGLDYAVVRPTADNMSLPWSTVMFDDLRTMESAAMALFAERAR